MANADSSALLAPGAALFIAVGDVIQQHSRTMSPTSRSATLSCSRGCWGRPVVARRRKPTPPHSVKTC
jgi:hypothetical protein